MITALIRWSIANRYMVLLATGFIVAWGIYSVQDTPVDALPDLSDVQVIVKTSFPGQAPQVVEDQVTYPLTTAMFSVPKAVTVRGYSFFGDSFVYIIFEDGTDIYWARSRVLEYLSQVTGQLPDNAKPALGPDATGVGWVFEYALVDRTGQHDLAELRSLQDWFLKYELQTVPGVAEVATIGGMDNRQEHDKAAREQFDHPWISVSRQDRGRVRGEGDCGERCRPGKADRRRHPTGHEPGRRMVDPGEEIVLATRPGQGGAQFSVGRRTAHRGHATRGPQHQDDKAGLDLEELESKAGENAGPDHVGDDNRGHGPEAEFDHRLGSGRRVDREGVCVDVEGESVAEFL